MDEQPPVRIDPGLLETHVLRSVIEEFVTRDGTDVFELDGKVAAVHALLERGEAELWFDPATETCNIVRAPARPT